MGRQQQQLGHRRRQQLRWLQLRLWLQLPLQLQLRRQLQRRLLLRQQLRLQRHLLLRRRQRGTLCVPRSPSPQRTGTSSFSASRTNTWISSGVRGTPPSAQGITCQPQRRTTSRAFCRHWAR